MAADRDALLDLYRRYHEVCNAHAFDRLGEFVAEDVVVDGRATGLDAYAAGLRAVTAAFPDYHWQLQHLLVDGDWLAAHFADSGTHTGADFLGVAATGTAARTQEFAFYRIAAGRIAEVHVTADNLVLLDQLRSGG